MWVTGSRLNLHLWKHPRIYLTRCYHITVSSTVGDNVFVSSYRTTVASELLRFGREDLGTT